MKGWGIKVIYKEWDKILDQMVNGFKVKGIGIFYVKVDKEVVCLKGKLNELFLGIEVMVWEMVFVIVIYIGLGVCCLIYYME